MTVSGGVISSPTISQATGGLGLKLKDTSSETGDLIQAQDSLGNILAELDYQGNLTVQKLEVKVDLTLDGHFLTTGTKPTVALGASSTTGSGATYTISGDDTLGKINVHTGSGVSSSGTLATITFSRCFSTTPPNVLLSPSSASAASSLFFKGNVTTCGFDIDVNATPGVAQDFTFDYFVGQSPP